MNDDLTPELREMLRLAYQHGFYAGRANAGCNATAEDMAAKYVALEPIPAVQSVRNAGAAL
jgi:hypothetical protein